MKKEILDYVTEKTHEMMRAHSCSAEAKAAGQAWLDAVGTEKEAEETKRYIEELEEDIMPIDSLIAFAESEGGAKVFGEEKSKEVAAHAREIKAAGAKYCDCPACAAAEAILMKKEDMLS
ncbi:MAG TPA: molecular chaperone Hsp90 [Candidatus Mediterraneibacter pullistercoris]|nr:molecular chaperone Hsp90 [Candidatus Mediterraneibacter pullistercoris]